MRNAAAASGIVRSKPALDGGLSTIEVLSNLSDVLSLPLRGSPWLAVTA
jgi:hypothetical protein